MKMCWSPEPANEMEQKLLDTASSALGHARHLGASMAEVSISHGQGLSASVRKGEVETIEHNRDKSMGITVYYGHRSGHVSCSDFSENAIRESVETARNIARHTEQDECSGLADPNQLATEFPELDLCHLWDLSLNEAIDIAARCEAAALDSDTRITNSEGATLSSHAGVDIYANSHGFCGISHGSRHSTSCSLIAGQGEGMQRDYWYDSKCAPDDLESPESIGQEAVRRTVRRLGARKLSSGMYPVVYDSMVASSLVSHMVSAISGPGLYRKTSFLHDYLHKQIFPEGINIHEQPHIPKGVGSAAFDGEGVATRANRVVNNGILNSFLLDSYTARKLEMTSTANAGGAHNLTLDSTVEGGIKQILEQMDRGILVTELIGFGVNNVTGDYSRGAFGFWVEHGEIQYPVQEFTIAGNLIDMYLDVRAVGADVNENRNIRTGSILLEKIAVAGE